MTNDPITPPTALLSRAHFRSPLRRVAGALIACALVAGGCGSDDEDSAAVDAPETSADDGASTESTTAGAPEDGTETERETETSGDDPADGFAPVSDPPDDGSLDPVDVTLTEIAQLDSPVMVAQRTGTPNLYVAEREGRIKVLEVDEERERITEARGSLLDISDQVSVEGEQGLLGITFSSDGRTLYVSYTDEKGDSKLVQYEMDDDRVDERSRRELLTVDQPFANHNGGDIALGPDGFLYYALGDGGAANDPNNRAPDPNELLGKILRIDPQAGSDLEPYDIPDGNPYSGGGGRPEIFLSGVRNPWRFSFDPVTNALWIADVGQNDIEEVDVLADGEGAGADLGWSGYEGTTVHIEDRVRPDTIPPVYEYSHASGGCSITGGEVYRGLGIPELVGAYVFSDYCDGSIRALKVGEDNEAVAFRELGITVPSVVSIDAGPDGELYIVSLDGAVYRLEQRP